MTRFTTLLMTLICFNMLTPSMASQEEIDELRNLIQRNKAMLLSRAQQKPIVKETSLLKESEGNPLKPMVGYAPFERISHDETLYIIGYVSDSQLSVLSQVNRKFKNLCQEAAKFRLLADSAAAWAVPFIDSSNYFVPGLRQHSLIIETWQVISAATQTKQPLEKSWLSQVTRMLTQSPKTGHPLRKTTINVLKSCQGEEAPKAISATIANLLTESDPTLLPAVNAELLSILHMLEIPTNQTNFLSTLKRMLPFWGTQTALYQPEGFEAAKMYAIQAAKLGRTNALYGLILTQVDLSSLKVKEDGFFDQNLTEVISFYQTQEGRNTARSVIKYVDNEAATKFQNAFELALELSQQKNLNPLKSLMLFYHFSASSYLHLQRYDFLQTKVIEPLTQCVNRMSVLPLKRMAIRIYEASLHDNITLATALKDSLRTRIEDLSA